MSSIEIQTLIVKNFSLFVFIGTYNMRTCSKKVSRSVF